jgi:hypothetical protein
MECRDIIRIIFNNPGVKYDLNDDSSILKRLYRLIYNCM